MVNLFLVHTFNPSVDIWDLEKYGFQYLSFQCTVQDLESDRRTFKVGFNLFHQNKRRYDLLPSEQGEWRLKSKGMEKTEDLWSYTLWEKIGLWPLLELQPVNQVKQNPQHPRHSRGLAVGTSRHVKWTTQKINASETNHVTLLHSTFLHKTNTPEPAFLKIFTVTKQHSVLIPLKLETDMDTNLSTAFQDLNCARVWLMVLKFLQISSFTSVSYV